MNSETAKMLKKASELTNTRYRVLKREWGQLTKTQRRDYRKRIQTLLDNHKQKTDKKHV